MFKKIGRLFRHLKQIMDGDTRPNLHLPSDMDFSDYVGNRNVIMKNGRPLDPIKDAEEIAHIQSIFKGIGNELSGFGSENKRPSKKLDS